ncbi:hypothetical protein [Chondromyces apiculatus]|uniref:hypothetical protein n=1 Tax=Chondromyces apiculatus TaxID=51 RepID=UPI0018CC5AAA|nr:hypothetical protein [Chondromyces apiculatus]
MATLAAVVVLPAGCTQDFGRFEPLPTPTCGETEKLCNGGCVSRLNAAYGCGESCTPCAFPNATAACVGDVCEIGTCAAGFANCDGADDGGNGCETSLNTTTNCGVCGRVCDGAEAGTATCVNGICGQSNCPAGFADCDDDASNGCEANLAEDATNCGTCGRPCSDAHVAGDPQCQDGLCVPACLDGFGDCTHPDISSADDGCESDLSNNVDHCGACDRECSGEHVASRSCSDGLCDSTCQIGWGNCTQPPPSALDDGCEDGVDNDNDECGSCINDCRNMNPENADAFTCSAGPNPQKTCGCTVDGDCNGDGTAAGTCTGGACTCNGTACRSGEVCILDGATSACSCMGGDGCGNGMTCCDAPLGCTNLSNNPGSCGACGRTCPSGFGCFNGRCHCNGDDDCDAGGGGSCSQGFCTCSDTECERGQRCQPDGQCG